MELRIYQNSADNQEIERLRAQLEVATSAMLAAVSKAEWQARTNQELNDAGAKNSKLRGAVFDLANKGWQPADIADKLGILRDTVKTMLYRARKAGDIPSGPKQGETRKKH